MLAGTVLPISGPHVSNVVHNYQSVTCWRQLICQSVMPHDPPMLVEDATDVAPDFVDACYQTIGGWVGSIMFYRVDQATYDRYWSRVSIGLLLSVAYHIGNIDVFSRGALRTDFALPGPSTAISVVVCDWSFRTTTSTRDGRGHVWTTQGSQKHIAITPVPDERVDELIPQLEQLTMDQLREYAREITHREEGVYHLATHTPMS